MIPLHERNVFLFDLDNTLYSPKTGILDQIADRMVMFVADEFNLTHSAAKQFCFDYYHKYGGTLRGLQLHHPEVDLNAFSVYAHDVTLELLPTMPELAQVLEQTNKQRVVFTNSPRPYAERLLDHMGLSHCFSELFTVELVDYKMKPNPHAFERCCQYLGIKAEDAVMFDDQPANLITAKDLGMRTVLVNREDLCDNSHNACYRTEDLTDFLTQLQQARPQ